MCSAAGDLRGKTRADAMKRNARKTLLMVTHNLVLAEKFSDRIVEMETGHVMNIRVPANGGA